MTYYSDKARCFAYMHEQLDIAKRAKKNISISNVIYQFCKTYPVSDRAIQKQIERYAKINGLQIKDDILVMEG